MALFKTGNPVLNENTFTQRFGYAGSDVMTVKGTLNKFGILSLLTIASAGLAWKMAASGVHILMYMIITALLAFGCVLLVSFKIQLSPYLAPVYALLKGFAVGAISSYYNYKFQKYSPDLITQAVTITFGVVIAMYGLYKFNIIRATPLFRKVVIMATVGLVFFYLIACIMRAFGVTMPFLHEGTPFGIIFSLVVVTLAAMNLILNFDNIETGAKMGAPKFMEWYGALGLLITIIWLYLEILRLFSKLSSSKRD